MVSRSATHPVRAAARDRRAPCPTASNATSLFEPPLEWPVGRDVVVCVDAPTVTPESLLEFPNEPTHEYAPNTFWASGDETVVGLGCFAELDAVGAERFAVVRAWAEERLARLSIRSPGHDNWSPRVFCGFAFSSDAAVSPEWQPFGAARAVLPRVVYVQRAGQPSRLCLTVGEHEQHQFPQFVDDLQSLKHQIAASIAPSSEPGIAPDRIDHMPFEQWRQTIDAALAAINEAALGKVVAARSGQLTFAKAISIGRTMRALAQTHPDSTRFVFVRQSSAFLGATPERLLRKRGRQIETEALAGTFSHLAPLEQTSQHAQMTSLGTKERSEHSPVLQSILETLGPLCTDIQYDREPKLRFLKHMLHLRTAVQAELAGHHHILDLVERLHPTPAVGGVPAQAALQWIVQNERFARGWYAGPIGWFDGAGDGQFDVALRSGIVKGCQALLFAGAGIVKGSVPEREFEETELKFRGLQAALRTVS